MDDLARRIAANNAARAAMYERVMKGEQSPPPCTSCRDVKQEATHVSENITPAGYHAWQCDIHVPKTPERLWGSDPGWPTAYVRIEVARERWAQRGTQALARSDR